MGLSNSVMREDRAFAIAEQLFLARRKYGTAATIPVDKNDLEQALCVVYEAAIDAMEDEVKNFELIDERDELKADNTKLKQQLSGKDTAIKRKAARIEELQAQIAALEAEDDAG